MSSFRHEMIHFDYYDTYDCRLFVATLLFVLNETRKHDRDFISRTHLGSSIDIDRLPKPFDQLRAITLR